MRESAGTGLVPVLYFMMDSHKLLWHLDRVNEWLNGSGIAPLHIDLGITTGCNISCVYCYGVLQGRTGVNDRFDMPKDIVIGLLKDAKDAGVRSIAFDGSGENTLNESLYDALDYAREIDLDVGLATNGVLLKKERSHYERRPDHPQRYPKIIRLASRPGCFGRSHFAPAGVSSPLPPPDDQGRWHQPVKCRQ